MEKEKTIALKVPKAKAESMRRLLIEKNLLRTDLIILKNEKYLYLPIKEDTENDFDFPFVDKVFKKRKEKIESYKELIDLPDDLLELLPTSFDIIGSIALLKLSDELLAYKNTIGKALISAQSQVETVCLIQPVAGELRTRSVEVVAGKKTTLTVHKEYGLCFFVDVEKTYYSPRLAGERHRVSKLVKNGEMIVDMFTGVAPFPVMIASFAQPKKIIATDKNKDAIRLAEKNVNNNKVSDNVELFCDDAENIEVLMKKKNVLADRVIMNLPFRSFEFFSKALNIINDTAVIHYYEIRAEDTIDERITQLNNVAEKKNMLIVDTVVHKIKTYAPREFYIGIDIIAK